MDGGSLRVIGGDGRPSATPADFAPYVSAGYRTIADCNGNPHAAHWFEKEL